jgi:peroxiredoxin
MKKLFYPLILILAITSCKNEKITISGKFDNTNGETVLLQRMDLNSNVTIDSVSLKKDGTFKLTTNKVTEPTFFQLTFNNSKNVVLLLDSTETVNVDGDLKKFDSSLRISQSQGAKELYDMNYKAAQLQKSIMAKLESLKNLKDDEQMEYQKRINEITKDVEDYKNSIYDYVFEHPRSFVSYYLLFQNVMNTPVFDVMDKKDHVSFATLATSLNLLYPQSERVKHLYSYVLNAKNAMKRNETNMQIINSAEKIGFPDIKEKDINGNEHKLSDLKGKVVLLSFWAAWDEKSVKENRNILKVYNKYHSKGFEVFQVSLDKSKVLWESAINKDNLPWINVSDLRHTDSYWMRLYNISKIPSNFLLDRDGEMIGKDLYGSMLDEKIAAAVK